MSSLSLLSSFDVDDKRSSLWMKFDLLFVSSEPGEDGQKEEVKDVEGEKI